MSTMYPHTGPAVPFKIPGLDGLRACSVLLVMLSHSALGHIVPGVLGVTIFFFISGFLITTLLLREHRQTGRLALGAFYMRRMLRLYPPLLVFVILCAGVTLWREGSVNLLGLGSALFYFANYVAIFHVEALRSFGGHLWSLAVEEHFYALFPLLLIWLLGRPRLTFVILPALCLIALAVRIFVTLRYPDIATDYANMATEARMDAVLAGAITAFGWNRPTGADFVRRITWWPFVVAAIALMLATLVIRDPAFRSTLRFSLQELALVPLVLAATVSPRFGWLTRLLERAPMQWIGQRSYALYLWHLWIFELMLGLAVFAGQPVVALMAGWLLSFLAAEASFRLVERPIFALRRRFGSHVEADSASPEPKAPGRIVANAA